MGVLHFIYSATETVKRNAPDLSLVSNVFKASYGYSSAAFWKIDDAVRVNGVQTLKNCMPDKQGRVWDFIYSATEREKRNAPDLSLVSNAFKASYGYGSAAFRKINDTVRVNSVQTLKNYMPDKQGRVLDFIYSTTERVKRNALDLSPVNNACKASYGYGSAAFWKINDAVRVNGVQTLKTYMPDKQGRVLDFIYSTTETVKRNAKDLSPVNNACKAFYSYGSAAFWKINDSVRVNGVQTLKNYMLDKQGRALDFIYSTTEIVKRNAPDLSPVSNTCKASYGYGSAAFWKIDDAVRVNGVQTLKNYMPDEQDRAQITLFASKLARNVAYYCLKESYNFVPGGKTVAKIVSQTVSEVKSENKKRGCTEVVDERLISSPGNTSGGIRNVIGRAERQSKGMEFGYKKVISADSASNQTLEDILRIFMKEFMGSRFDDLIIPRKGQGDLSFNLMMLLLNYVSFSSSKFGIL